MGNKIIDFQGKRYNDYGSYIKMKFGERVQKISIDIGFTCPNRDGSKGYGGCTYCNNNSFNPDYCKPEVSISDQLQKGIEFFQRKRKIQKFLAYFQAYTNTYADVAVLKEMYLEALNVPGVIGLVIGTRPDCISDDVIELLADIAKNYYVSLEFGVESTNERTLIEVNRCHTYEETKAAYKRCANKGIELGAHIILGLPGESREDLLKHAVALSKLPISTLKLHHLQIVKGSVMAAQYKNNPDKFNLFELQNYIEFVAEFIELLRPNIVIERFISEAPGDLLIAPKWGLKNFEVVAKLDKYLQQSQLHQGKKFQRSLA